MLATELMHILVSRPLTFVGTWFLVLYPYISTMNCSLHCVGFQCLMYLYHYQDVWYDYATWHAKSGSIDSAIKVFQRALKALPGFLSFTK